MNLHDRQAILERINSVLPQLDALCAITGTPGVSFGVLHERSVILTHSTGIADVESNSGIDSNTQFVIASITKSFVAAACGILVDEGKLGWDKPISHHLPSFNPITNPELKATITLRDLLSHNTGLARLDNVWQGLHNACYLTSNDVISVANNLPAVHPRDDTWLYNNWMYGVAALLIEEVSGMGWADFLHTRIFKPLGMTRTSTSPTPADSAPHVVYADGSPHRIPASEISHRNAIGAAAAIHSTPDDMLRWASAVLDAFNPDPAIAATSILKQIPTITNATVTITDDTSYCLGWATTMLPSPDLGHLSPNGWRADQLIGANSPQRKVLFHNGQIFGHLSSLYLFPDTNSAIVVLANAEGLGDASVWATEMLMQALFDLQPPIDVLALAREQAERELTVWPTIQHKFRKHQVQNTLCPPLAGYLGTYQNEGLKMRLDIFITVGESWLTMRVNGGENQIYVLKHYHYDCFGFLPASRDEWMQKVMVDFVRWDMFVVRFERDVKGRVVEVVWRLDYDKQVEPVVFKKEKGESGADNER